MVLESPSRAEYDEMQLRFSPTICRMTMIAWRVVLGLGVGIVGSAVLGI